MKSLMIVALLTILRLGIPASLLLIIGEAMKRRGLQARQARGV